MLLAQIFPSKTDLRNSWALNCPAPHNTTHCAQLGELPEPATQPETDSERKTESWDTHEGHIQEVIGEQHTATGLECQVVICTTRWLPRVRRSC